MPARRAVAVTLAALLLGALLNAGDLLATARQQPFGWPRQVAVTVTEPLYQLSRALGLDRPRAALDRALGNDAEPAPAEAVVAAPSPSSAPPDPGAATAAPSPRRRAPSPQADRPTPSPTASEARVVGAADPLRMFVAGDSMVGQFGPAMQDLAGDTGVVTTQVQYEFKSGLTRPDFLDWPARMREVGAAFDPDVIVFFIGGNDPQPLKLDGVVREPGDPVWVAEYRRRVEELMDQLQTDGRRVYWIGMPIARDAEYTRRMRMLNDIYATEASTRPAITFVSSWEVFTGPDGQFSEYLPDDDGDLVDMRLNDGIHLTTAGAYRLARVVFGRIVEELELRDAPGFERQDAGG